MTDDLVVDLFNTVLPPLGKGYPEYRDDQARGSDGRWSGGGGSGASEGRAKGGKPRKTGVSDATVKRRAAKARKELEAAAKQSRDALEKAKTTLKKPQPNPDSLERIRRALEDAKNRQQQANDQLRKEPEEVLKGLRTTSIMLGIGQIALEVAILSQAVQFAGAVHPLAGVAVALGGLAYITYDAFQLLRGKD
jgi:hypothetical protein